MRRTVKRAAHDVIHGKELDDSFQEIICEKNLMTIAGFGSLLSETSARSTFPMLENFRLGRIQGFRRVFAHTCNIFFDRGIANPVTREISSLSVEHDPDSTIIVSLFEVNATPQAIADFIEREHEFRFLCVRPEHIDGRSSDRLAVICGRNEDETYKQSRCPPEEWQERYGRHNIDRIWRDDILPCRVYLRHCVLAAARLGSVAEENFLDESYLADRTTTVREWLSQNRDIMEQLPPPSLIGRYSG